MASIPLIFRGGLMGTHADSAQSAYLTPVGFRETQRNSEFEADRFGLELATRAKFNCEAFRRYIERTQAPDSPMLPARELRLARIDEFYARLPLSPIHQQRSFRKFTE
jgi:predicted Zn-dependent protease